MSRERDHHGAAAAEPVSQRPDRRRRDHLGPDRGSEHGGDLLRVEAAPGQPHRPERQLDPDHQKARRVEQPEPPTASPGLSRQRQCHRFGLDDAALRAYVASVLVHLNQASALISVVIIDVVLAGDNAIVVGMAAAGLPLHHRRRIIVLGIAAATVLRILFAFVALELLETVIGMTLAGGLLLLWVAWKMYREICAARPVVLPAGATSQPATPPRREKTQAQALFQIVVADLSMSLDNVLAVAGVAHEHPYVLALGLALSVALMGIASTLIARMLDRAFWISWIGLGIVTFVALRMIWDGSEQIFHQAAALGFSAS